MRTRFREKNQDYCLVSNNFEMLTRQCQIGSQTYKSAIQGKVQAGYINLGNISIKNI